MTTLTLGYALCAVTYVLEPVETRYVNRPLSVAACDANGELLSLAWMDNAKLLIIELTRRKTHTSGRLGCIMQAFLQRPQEEQLDISYFVDSRFTALSGGIPIPHQGKRLGVVTVGGLSAREDHDAALLVVEILLKEITR